MTSEELQEKMERFGYTDRTLSEDLGCTPQAVWGWRHNKKLPAYIDRFFEHKELEEAMAQAAYRQIVEALRSLPKPVQLRVIKLISTGQP